MSAESIGIAGIVWPIFMHIIAGAMGGYLAGRLRTRWTDLHTDEVFFRDTAHGFLVWAVSLVVTAASLRPGRKAGSTKYRRGSRNWKRRPERQPIRPEA